VIPIKIIDIPAPQTKHNLFRVALGLHPITLSSYSIEPNLIDQDFFHMSTIVNVTDSSFDADVLQSDIPVLVDYWAEWCGPCKMLAPILDEIAQEYAGRMTICKLNIDDNEATPPKYGIRGIPTLMLFKNGAVDATKVGALSKSQLAAFIDSNL
jgi:thioredoxin 1